MNPKLRLKVFPVVLLMVVQVVGMGGVARSQMPPMPSDEQLQKDKIERLVPRLGSSDVAIQRDSILELGNIGEPAQGAIPKITLLLRDRNVEIRSTALYALGNFGPTAQSAIPNILPLLKDSDAFVRSSAAFVLGKLGKSQPGVIAALQPLLQDPESDVQSSAAFALRKLGVNLDPSAPQSNSGTVVYLTPDFKNATEADLICLRRPSTSVDIATCQKRVAELVKEKPELLNPAKPVEVPNPQAGIPMLIDQLKNATGESRASAGVRLAQKGRLPTAAMPQLISLLLNADSGSAMLRTFESMGTNAESALPYLMARLKQPNQSLDWRFFQAFAALDETAKPAVPDLVAMLKTKTSSGSEWRAESALSAMGKGSASAVPDLIGLLKDPDPQVRDRAIMVLGNIGEPAKSAVPSLTALLSTKSAQLPAAEALGKMGESAKPAIPNFIELLRSPDKTVRLTVAKALGKMGNSAKSAIPGLVALLQDAEEGVQWFEDSPRFEALRALGEMDGVPKSTIPRLVQLLQDEKRGYLAAAVLGKMTDSGASIVPLVTPLLKHKSGSVRGNTIGILWNLGDASKPAIPSLVPLLNDPVRENRWDAESILKKLGYKP
jgi:HEAT repeat protein